MHNLNNSPINPQTAPSPQNPSLIGQSIKSNLQILCNILHNNKNIHLSQSVSSISTNKQQQFDPTSNYPLLPLVRTFLENLTDPFKSLPIYTKIIAKLDSLRTGGAELAITNSLFEYTMFSGKMYGILTLFLKQETPYYVMSGHAEKIVDVFYKFMFYQYPELMESNLRANNIGVTNINAKFKHKQKYASPSSSPSHKINQNNQTQSQTLPNISITNIGKWFYQQGIQKLFHKYYFTAQDFTILVSKFMLHGLAVLFIAGVAILKKCDFVTLLQSQLDSVRFLYVSKYGLQ